MECIIIASGEKGKAYQSNNEVQVEWCRPVSTTIMRHRSQGPGRRRGDPQPLQPQVLGVDHLATEKTVHHRLPKAPKAEEVQRGRSRQLPNR